MKNWLKKKLGKPEKKYLYDLFLRNDPEVVGQTPKVCRELGKDFDLCLYVVPLKDGEYAKAIIQIAIKDVIVNFKYDTGRVLTNYSDMLEECIPYITRSWGLDVFRVKAQEELKQLSLLDQFLYL